MMAEIDIGRVLVLGASGMLGNAVYRFLSSSEGCQAFGTVRSPDVIERFPMAVRAGLIPHVDATRTEDLARVISDVAPTAIINCVGVVKQLDRGKDPLEAIPINSLLPHQIHAVASKVGSRVIQISTDCVFSGRGGDYTEDAVPDASDLYARSKLLGELEGDGCVTLRTSIIGREIDGAHGLVDWFLSQEGEVEGYSKAIFSGLPTCELARVIREYVLPNPDLTGLYHVSAAPIDKCHLLRLLADAYSKPTVIRSSDRLVIDRSLNCDRFFAATGYRAPSWPDLVRALYDFG